MARSDFILYLHGKYYQKHLPYYKRLAGNKFKVAVDGGYNFFRKTGLVPDLLIGDFDSLKRLPQSLPKKTEVVRYPVHKDKTDIELALDYCLEHKAKSIEIVQPEYGEPDQFIGNFMALSRIKPVSSKAPKPKVVIRNVKYDLVYLHDETLTIRNRVGEGVSVVPLSPGIRYTCRGMEFEAAGIRVNFGESIALRNRITSKTAFFEVKGKALLVHRFR